MIFSSIRARMATMFLFSITLVMVISCGGLIIYSRYMAEGNAARLLDSTAKRFQTESANSERPGDFRELLGEEKGNVDSKMSIFIMDESGGIIAKSTVKEGPIPNPKDRNWRVQTISLGRYVVLIALDWRDARHSLPKENKLVTITITESIHFFILSF